MAWIDGPLVVYHGTDSDSGQDIVSNGVDWRRGNPVRDFGRGFYTTTMLRQAAKWANVRTLETHSRERDATAIVLAFSIPRTRLDGLSFLCFVQADANSDYWEFVEYCRRTSAPHRATGRNYDAVFGPVSRRWQKRMAIPGYDQVSFHTDVSSRVLATASIAQAGSPLIR
jgi:hypothetical protein